MRAKTILQAPTEEDIRTDVGSTILEFITQIKDLSPDKPGDEKILFLEGFPLRLDLRRGQQESKKKQGHASELLTRELLKGYHLFSPFN